MFMNLALPLDLSLLSFLYFSPWGSLRAVFGMFSWTFATKTVKLIPHFRRHPVDMIYCFFFFCGYVPFAYYHNFIKLYALLTFGETSWGGRNLDAIDASPATAPANNDSAQGNEGNEDNEGTTHDDIELKEMSRRPAASAARRKTR